MELLKSIFSGVLTMSLKAIPVILLVLLLRFALRRAPKRWAYALWAVPLYRLVCPAALPAAFSLYNLSFLPRSTRSGGATGTAADFFNLQGTSQAVSPPPGTLAGVQTSPAASAAPAASNAVTAAEHAATQAASSGTAAAAAQTAIPHSVDWLTVATIVWLAGLALLLGWNLYQYLRLRRRTASAIRAEDGAWVCDGIAGPFVLGALRPKIYLPCWLGEESRAHVLAHESCHLRRHDPLIRLIALFTAALHWFNPLVWLGFKLMEQDMEMSCDEAALRALGAEKQKDYSRTLLALGTGRRGYGPALAFGMPAAKKRILHVLNLRRTGRRTLALASAVLLLAGLTCCTDAAPKTPTGQIRETEQSVADRTEQLTDDITLSYDYELPESTQSVALAVKGTGLFESELVTLWSGAANELTGSLALTNLSNDFDVSIQLTHDDNYENTFEFNGAGSLYTPSHTKLVPNGSDAITLTQDRPSLLFTAAVEGAGSPIGTYEFYLYPASTAADCIPFLPEIGDLPQRLYDARTDYLGDASAVVNLLNTITTSRNTAHDAFCTGSSMELHTDAEPYGMVVNESSKDLNLLGCTANSCLIREQFRTGALMLALVGNLDRYYEQFDQVSGLELSNLTVETAEQVLGIDDLKSFGQSADGVAKLLGLIDLALNNSDWLNSSTLLMEPLGTLHYRTALDSEGSYWQLNLGEDGSDRASNSITCAAVQDHNGYSTTIQCTWTEEQGVITVTVPAEDDWDELDNVTVSNHDELTYRFRRTDPTDGNLIYFEQDGSSDFSAFARSGLSLTDGQTLELVDGTGWPSIGTTNAIKFGTYSADLTEQLREEFQIIPRFTLNEDGTFQMDYDPLFSYDYSGTYQIVLNRLTLTADNGDSYRFRIEENGSLIFIQRNSTPIRPTAASTSLPDGTRFNPTISLGNATIDTDT